jgi:hypothetical protein
MKYRANESLFAVRQGKINKLAVTYGMVMRRSRLDIFILFVSLFDCSWGYMANINNNLQDYNESQERTKTNSVQQ